MEPVDTPLPEALGRVLADDLVAPLDLPRFDNSAMDGYALRSVETHSATAANPVTLRIAGNVDAGQEWDSELPPSWAIRIGTGAAVPDSCDAVVAAEHVSESGSSIAISIAVHFGENVRPRGEDIRTGDRALDGGTLLRPQEIALLGSLGIERTRVVPPARVGIVSIGPELMAGAKPAPVPDANGPMLASLVHSSGATVVRAERSNGDRSALLEQLHALATTTDLILSSGGISDSPADTLTLALESMKDVELWNLRLRPGKHFAAGKIGRSVMLALPGNPVAAFVGFLLFGRPAIEQLMSRQRNPPIRALAVDSMSGSTGRLDALRGYGFIDADSVLRVDPVQNRGSGIVSSLPAANCLILLPEDVTTVDAGESVEIRWVNYP